MFYKTRLFSFYGKVPLLYLRPMWTYVLIRDHCHVSIKRNVRCNSEVNLWTWCIPEAFTCYKPHILCVIDDGNSNFELCILFDTRLGIDYFGSSIDHINQLVRFYQNTLHTLQFLGPYQIFVLPINTNVF